MHYSIKLLLATLTLSTAVILRAEENQPPQPPPGMEEVKRPQDKFLQRMVQDLGLSEEQENRIEAIIREEQDAMRALHNSTQDKIKAELTPEQRQKFDELRQHGPRHRGMENRRNIQPER